MTVRLHIDRLVIDAGLGATRGDEQLFEEAMVAELRTRIAADSGGGAPADEPARPAAPIPARIGALATDVAEAIHRSIRQ